MSHTDDTSNRGSGNTWQRLKARWGVSNWGIVAILLAFALAGSTVLKISRPIVGSIVGHDAPRWLWWTVRIVVIVPIYEMLLLFYGTVLGQGRFFRDKQGRLLRRLSKPFRRLYDLRRVSEGDT